MLVLIFALNLLPLISDAQGCSVCTKTAAGLDSKSAKGMNNGIIYLAAFPLGILGTLGYIWWRSEKMRHQP